MIEKIIDKIINKQLEEKTISEEEVSIYKYGYRLVYEMLINLAIAIIIGIISKKLTCVLIFLLLYIPLRSFCGGWHADKVWKCTIYSNAILIVLVFITDFFAELCTNLVLIMVFILCSILVYALSPIGTKTKPLDEYEKKAYKRIINIIQAVHIILFVLFAILDVKKIVFILEFVYIIQLIMLIIEIVSKNVKS